VAAVAPDRLGPGPRRWARFCRREAGQRRSIQTHKTCRTANSVQPPCRLATGSSGSSC